MIGSRFWIIVAMLGATGILLHTKNYADTIPVSEPLVKLPHNLAGWSGDDVQIAPESLDVLGPGEFLSRSYTQDAQPQPVGLFIAYFPTQRTGVSIHSPRNCLPGSGWAFESSDYVDLKDTRGEMHRVGEYIVTDGEDRQFVIYWYQAHGRSVANEYVAKFHMVIDAMRMNRTDGALVRVATPIGRFERTSQAKARAEAFASRLVPLLPRFIPG